MTDANVVLGYLPESLLGGDMALDRAGAGRAVQAVADALGIGLYQAAEGIVDIVNENMFGALRLVSVQQGYDPRDFALMAFGGAGPLHANALGRLMGAWPVVIPPSPGVLCAYGDATTRLRAETQRSFGLTAEETTDAAVAALLEELGHEVAGELTREGVAPEDIDLRFEADMRYQGQAFEVPLPVSLDDFSAGTGLGALTRAFDTEHERLFTFNLDMPRELVNLRATALGPASTLSPEGLDAGDGDISSARLREHTVFMDGAEKSAAIYDRTRLRAGDRVPGPAVIVEMDSTTLVLDGCIADIDSFGNILITPA